MLKYLNKVIRVTASPYGSDNHPSEKALDDHLKAGWLIKEMHVVTLTGSGVQNTYDVVYHLQAPDGYAGLLLEKWQ